MEEVLRDASHCPLERGGEIVRYLARYRDPNRRAVLVMQGDDDQIVSHADAGPLCAQLLPNATLKAYQGFPHGLPLTQADTINADLLAFVQP
jgi:pimeloyl-ACP methyl ester carboxylesterase